MTGTIITALVFTHAVALVIGLKLGTRNGRSWGIVEAQNVIANSQDYPLPMRMQLFDRVRKLSAQAPPWRRPAAAERPERLDRRAARA